MSKKGKKKKEDKPSVEKILKSFKDNLFGVKLYFDKFGDKAENEDVEQVKENSDYLEKCLKELGVDLNLPDEEKKKLEISEDKFAQFTKKLRKQPKISMKNFEILSSSSFLMLNNYFEYLLADLLTYFYSKFKDSIKTKELKVSLNEINEYDSIEELENSLILKEVETMLVELSFDSLLDHFNRKLKVELEKDIVDWDKIIELRERRHIIVHNGSLVNKKYITRSKNPFNLKVGDKVTIDKEYFKSAFDEIKLAGLILCYNCWGNWDKENLDDAVYEMLMDSFDALLINNSEFCYRLTRYIENIDPRTEDQEDYLLRAKFNQCISLKQLGKKSELKKELSKIKVGTSTPIFKLAHATLSDKSDKTILELIKQTKAIKDIDLDDYNEWPLFSFLRDKKELNDKIIEELKN
jgi:hypothetical protein